MNVDPFGNRNKAIFKTGKSKPLGLPRILPQGHHPPVLRPKSSSSRVRGCGPTDIPSSGLSKVGWGGGVGIFIDCLRKGQPLAKATQQGGTGPWSSTETEAWVPRSLSVPH